ncbi:MAG TPA: tRNA preQ1(34) S-adenosylmethionine ribosyltransferase-isomerase QueA [Candidatus Aminicenantes bacterium]|nr:tRNA preQ1(34) S-adenosylmethionine ribosyltransferase-isomerase QueA [Candidatus Aminicenantes bacterium]HRY65430.1 tRNA preQ1(34) S-adenosylmethionine ribosyltransferase-isomerase QueA [Candidatus Aminicenantes bacterium]HRZ72102.1 tRNA preQ1(34) S-adenosylmethionine ribosyltransferase-isomerase QueA [Candidatus Aminicenantes bacterium]
MTCGKPLRVSDFDYDLPPELIAQHPLPRRDDSRMMVVDRRAGTIRHGRFREFAGLMGPGDLLVLNDTRVLPARLWGLSGQARIEFLFIRETGPGLWEVLCRPAKRVRDGDAVRFPSGAEARAAGAAAEGRRLLDFGRTDVRALLRESGYAPLPPYIKRARQDEAARPEDIDRYQTVFARKEGAIAAPTAGLHFTRGVLRALEDRGVGIQRVTLDVGLATFQPVRADLVAEHTMLEETYSVSPAAAMAVNASRSEGRPVTAVGTTVVRTLESAWRDGAVRSGRRSTALFITPGFEFHVVGRLLTNFHLPKSTLLMLVSAFAGYDLMMAAYRRAVEERYRFFSYGDCMLIV